MDEGPHTSLACGLGNGARAFHVQRIKCLFAGRGQDGNQIDGHVGTVYGRANRLWIADVRLDRVDLTDTAHGLQMTGKIWPADGRSNPCAILGQRPHRVATDKSRTAKNGGQSTAIKLWRH